MYITDIHIQNFKLLRDFRLSFGTAEKPRMWTVLVAENGLCKTSILRAIAMAATGPTRANQLADVPSLPDRRRPKEELRIEAHLHFGKLGHKRRKYPGLGRESRNPPQLHSTIHLDPGHSTLLGESAYRDDGPSTPDGLSPLEDAVSQNLPDWFVAGYGTSRLLPHPFESKRPSLPSKQRLDSLFDRGEIIGTGFSSLFDRRKLGAFNKALRKALIERHEVLPMAVDLKLRGRNFAGSPEDLMEGDLFTLREGSDEVKIPATWLSQGYQSTIAWIADLIGHCIFEQDRPIRLETMEGLVLIDEIDLHLHPKWQAQLIPELKEIFPRLQFVVTTHSPMVLAGVQSEEIVRLVQDNHGNIIARPEPTPENPKLLTSSQIYNRYFDVDRTQPARLGAALRRYGSLVTADPEVLDAEDREEKRGLRRQLVAAGLDPDREIL
jgi:hypothetical protein